MARAVNRYFKNTNTLLYSFLVSLPLFLLYEVLILISQPDGEHIVRISVDVWIKSLFTQFGVNAMSFTLLIVAIAGLFILYKEKAKIRNLRFVYFPLLLLEASLYAIVVALISNSLVTLVINLISQAPFEALSFTQKFALSLGAGLYEELFFRVILVSLLSFLFVKIFKEKWAGILAAVILSALIFSTMHYIGSMGDMFTIGSFLYRFIFGLILNGIFVLRGFGVAAWTHAIYDVMVITFLST